MPEPKTPIVLAIDIGTSSVKAGLYDATAHAIEHAGVSIPHEQDTRPDGAVEEPVERIVEAVEAAVDRVMETAARQGWEIAAVGMDSMASTVLGVDSEGVPVTPVYTYADTRPAEDVERLKSELDEDAVHERTGAMQHTSYVPARVLWLRRTQPDLADRVARWLDVSTYLYSRWLGTPGVAASYSIASWSGMLNRHELCWDEELLGHIGLSVRNLPGLTSFDQPQGELGKGFADRWPALAGARFFPAVGDGAAVNIGTACVTPERVALTVGTTSAMRVLIQGDAPTVPEGLWAYRLSRDATLMGGAFSEGGLLLEWASNVLQMPDLEELDSELEGRFPDSHGLTVLPFLAGERATGWSNRATGVFEGIRTSTTALDIVQAMMESVSLRFALVADLLLPERSSSTVFVASGGAVRSSEWWLQIMADALGSPVAINEAEQETSRGAAVLALFALGEIDSLYSFKPQVRATYRPRPDASDVLMKAAERQKRLYGNILK